MTQWDWHAGLQRRGVMVADCMLWDLIYNAELIFGAALQLDGFPALKQHYDECPGRGHFLALLAEFPNSTYTARPDEAGAFARIREAVIT